jgi:tetratricopeptide (TPR) repeat protein
VLVQAFDDRPQVERIASWELEAGDCGMHPEELRTDAESSRAVLEQFVALGYIEAPGENQKKAAEVAVREQKYNLARVYLFSRRPEQAVPLLEELTSGYPEEERFARHLAQAYVLLERHADAERALAKALRIDPDSAEAHLWMARVRLRQRRDAEAAEEALNAVGLEHFLPLGHFFLGVALSRLRHFRRAIQAFETVLQMAPGFAPAHRWLARVHSRPRGDKKRAREHRDWLREHRRYRRSTVGAGA